MVGAKVPATTPVTPALARGVSVSDIGLLPLIATLPFLYVPKVLEGDTQPWVLIGALMALFAYRPRRFFLTAAAPAVLLSAAALTMYALRAGFGPETIRAAYIFLTFSVLYVIVLRGGGNAFRNGVRLTLLIWFAVGAYQYIAILIGLPVEFVGRFVEGRGGVPSLAAEPSYFGSLAVLMAMYLLHDRQRGDDFFVAIAVMCVLMSGSLLAFLLLAFPFLYLRFDVKLIAGAAVAGLVLLDASFNDAGFTARLAGLKSIEQGFASLLADPSLNLRFGHIQFVLWDNLIPQLFWRNPIDFQNQYNSFAASTGVLIPTGSNFILPMAGELIYGGGLFGLGIVILLVVAAWRGGARFGEGLVRASFVIACLLNPISIANPFLVFYAFQERPCKPHS